MTDKVKSKKRPPVARETMTYRERVRQAIQLSTGPAYFVVKFSVDDTISMIPRRNIVGTTVPAVDDCCEVKWSSGEVLMATVLAAGDLSSMREAEEKALCKYLNDESAEGDKEASEPSEKNSPDKENARNGSTTKKRGRKRKALKEVQAKKPATKRKKKDEKFTFELGAAAKGLSPPKLQTTPITVGEQAKVAMDITESPLLSSSTSSSRTPAKGLSPTTLQSTPTSVGEQAKVAMDITESSLLSSSTSSLSDDGVIQHPSPKNKIVINLDSPADSRDAGDKVTSQLEYFMQSITSAVKLMDTRLVQINSKLTEVTKRQEVMEMSLKLLHESVRRMSVPAPVYEPVPSANDKYDTPWWITESLMREQMEQALQTPAKPPPTLAAPETPGDHSRVQPPSTSTPLPASGDQQLLHPPPTPSVRAFGDQQSFRPPPTLPAVGTSGDQQRPPPPPSTPTANNQTTPQFLSAENLTAIRTASVSRRNFAANINRKILSKEERMTSNVSGTKGKKELDPIKVAFIKRVTFQQYPLKGNESEKKAWGECVLSIDEANRRLNLSKH